MISTYSPPFQHPLGKALAACAIALAHLSVSAQTAVPTHTVQNVSGSQQGYTLDGVIEAIKQSVISAQASGRIAALLVKAGDKVRAGQVLATLDDNEAQVGVVRSQAQVNQADAELRNAKAQFERTRNLQGQGFVSQAALDTAQSQYKAAQAVRDQAQAGVRMAGISQGFTKVTAPFDGWVLQTLAQAGDLAVPGKPLLSLYAPQPLRAVVQVPASRVAAVRAALQVAILVQGDTSEVQGVTPLNRLEVPSFDPVSQTSEWRFDLPAKEAATLIPGQQIRVRFSAAESAGSQKLLLPSSAIVRRGELTAVYVQAGTAFALRAVRLGRAQEAQNTEVLSGLKPGDVVALDPVAASKPGAVAQAKP